MISLRQHIFSLVAVFVALAVGIAAGSTVVRGPLLDSTRARLESAEQNIELERAENDALAAELAQLDAWEVDGPDQLLEGRYAGGSVLMVVAGDVDKDVVDGVIRSVRASAGTFLGEVRLASEVFDPEEAARLGEVLGTDGTDGTDPA
ncbi:MAG: copper transporter, partial [Ilumatobacteraceae bacterium]